MKLKNVSTHFPDFCFTRKEVAQKWSRYGWVSQEHYRALESVIGQGKESYTFRVKSGSCATEVRLHQEYAPELCRAVAEKVWKGQQVDNLIVATSTGMIIPSLAHTLPRDCAFLRRTTTLDLVGSGCGVFFDVLRVLPAFPGTTLAVFVEVQSAMVRFPADASLLIGSSFCSDGAAACLFSYDGNWSVNNLKSEWSETGYSYDGEKATFSAGGELKPLPGNVVGDFHCAAASDYVLNKMVRTFPELNFDTAEHIMRNYGNVGSVGTLLALQRGLESGSKQFSLGSWGSGKNSICTLTHES